ncbi:ABC transporter permease [Nodularia spumigena]|uniref:ABC transporter permease n=1 Tax=Nodularia spumigena TaxID=70799 RepID=UPI0000EA9192|nr:ABC transporter permease [Nodularia spumigena]EAW46452.1 ABC-2 [Nodularia spumigena CCY9414]
MKISLKTNFTGLLLRRYWELLNVLVSRNLKVRYRGSFFGVYWSLLNPLLMTGLYSAILAQRLHPITTIQSSTIYWQLYRTGGDQFFSASTSQALSSIVNNGSLLNKISLPSSVFPVSIITSNVFQFSVGVLPVLAVITFIYSQSLVNVLALFFPFLALVLVSTGVGFLVSGLYVFFRDLPYFYELVVFVIWLSSPIFYPAAIVPPHIKQFLVLNPLSPIIESLRQITLSGTSADLGLIWGALLSGMIILSLGWACFHLWRDQFMDLL